MDPFFDFFESERPDVDREQWPGWKVEYKRYPRSQRIELSLPARLPDISLEKALKNRRTEREFAGMPLSMEEISPLLYWSAGLIHAEFRKVPAGENLRRPYPSGGSLFPIEIYLVLFSGKDIGSGIYHYYAPDHCLELIEGADPKDLQSALFGHSEKGAAGIIVLTFIGKRTYEKYGTLSYKIGLLEAGHIGQNLYLVGNALGLGMRALGSMKYDIARRALDLPPGESICYHLAIGYPLPDVHSLQYPPKARGTF